MTSMGTLILARAAGQVAVRWGSEHEGQLYEDGGRAVSDDEAASMVMSKWIHCPGAGSGSFGDVATRLGFRDVEPLDATSPAGDWSVLVSHDGYNWQRMLQDSRYPQRGFMYIVEPVSYYGTAALVRRQQLPA